MRSLRDAKKTNQMPPSVHHDQQASIKECTVSMVTTRQQLLTCFHPPLAVCVGRKVELQANWTNLSWQVNNLQVIKQTKAETKHTNSWAPK